MPRVEIVPTEVSIHDAAQLADVACDIINNHFMWNDGKTILIYDNGDVAPHTITITAVVDESGTTNTITQVVAAGAIAAFRPSPQSHYNQRTPSADRGKVFFASDVATNGRFAAIKLIGS